MGGGTTMGLGVVGVIAGGSMVGALSTTATWGIVPAGGVGSTTGGGEGTAVGT